MFKYKISYCSFKSSSSKRIYCIPSQPAAGRSQSEVSSDSNNRIYNSNRNKVSKEEIDLHVFQHLLLFSKPPLGIHQL